MGGAEAVEGSAEKARQPAAAATGQQTIRLLQLDHDQAEKCRRAADDQGAQSGEVDDVEVKKKAVKKVDCQLEEEMLRVSTNEVIVNKAHRHDVVHPQDGYV